ncbi:hypothetical protein SAMD00019534_011440, partial [Acytostelium subglobosum LB1]|uniref:hypothetical protein n=1 Tax=Acytostelium subglobosum LB1 TaxID=1410327 RepID=UPI000644F1BF
MATTKELPTYLILKILELLQEVDEQPSRCILPLRLVSKRFKDMVTQRLPWHVYPRDTNSLTIQDFMSLESIFNNIRMMYLRNCSPSLIDGLITLLESPRYTGFKQTLQHIDVGYIPSAATLHRFIDLVLLHCKRLIIVELESCGGSMHDESVTPLSITFPSKDDHSRNTLTYINVSLNVIDEQLIPSLPKSIKVLNLSACRFANEQQLISPMLAKSPTVCHHLTSLILSHSYIGASGCVDIGHVLASDRSSLKNLWLDYCSIGGEGLLTIGRSLEHNRSLKFISVVFNGIRQNEGESFIELLKASLSTHEGRHIGIHSEMNHWQLRDPLFSKDCDIKHYLSPDFAAHRLDNINKF